MSFNQRYIESLLQDEYFLKWVIDPDHQADEFWKRWMHDDDARIKAVSEAKALILNSFSFPDDRMPRGSHEAIWSSVHQKIASAEITQNKGIKNFPTQFLKYAAVALAIVSFIVVYNRVLTPQKFDRSSMSYLEEYAPAGSRLTVHLKDGTIVTLNGDSKIRYPSEFAGGRREVYLEGEAFFKVQKNVEPFVVHAAALTTTVLGTSFNVQAYGGKDQIAVAVVTGKVSVKKPGNAVPVFLHPSDQAVYNTNEDHLRVSHFDHDQVIGWKDGIMVFKDAEFDDIVGTLQRWYGVKIVVKKKPVVDDDFNGRFDNQTLETVLSGISFSLEFNYSIDGKTVVIN